MTEKRRSLLRLALAIQQSLAEAATHPGDHSLPERDWNRCQEILRRMQLARDRGWHAAAAEVRAELAFVLNLLRTDLDLLIQSLEAPARRESPASPRDVYSDLLVLEEEFDEVDWDLCNKILSVTTEPVVMEGVYLGPFEVSLEWQQLGDAHPYRVIARDPHPAASNEEVTHPHVEGERLCEGEAHVPIRTALRAGRLLDFFLIVQRTLLTYNSSSPYVALEKWEGANCRECGQTTDDEHLFYCQRCNDPVCDACYASCADCNEAFCYDCVAACGRCGSDFCENCRQTCPDCREPFCFECFPEGKERCSACHEKRQPTEEPDETQAAEPVEQPGPHAGPADQPNGVGQAAVSA